MVQAVFMTVSREKPVICQAPHGTVQGGAADIEKVGQRDRGMLETGGHFIFCNLCQKIKGQAFFTAVG